MATYLDWGPDVASAMHKSSHATRSTCLPDLKQGSLHADAKKSDLSRRKLWVASCTHQEGRFCCLSKLKKSIGLSRKIRMMNQSGDVISSVHCKEVYP